MDIFDLSCHILKVDVFSRNKSKESRIFDVKVLSSGMVWEIISIEYLLE